jgi:hypothetical protein
VGHDLTALPGDVQPPDATVAFQWLRDGVPVDGATAATYSLSSVDLGATMSVRITRSRRNYADLVETVAVARPVSAKPTVTMTAVGRSRRAVVWLRLEVPGVIVTGQVTAKVGGQVATADLVDGRAKLVVRGVEPGERIVRTWYAGKGPIRPARASTTIRVLR